ncbi:zinc finger C3H1 domain-containing protein isoform X2 [Pieris rapae]|uniref:zinc finger C3H1 domain-containing protein isoform X2 n=1 Tax=Pieris rapae TaxID=64459 RepID=UPI001E27EA33|nr:zinc finger C3H1 domain-containing protein isoform X2 [Pieris rapae]
MACLENMDSEREEGEIVDELDNLSDISSEEEFLLRQRLEILENYNNVLERKEAKRCTIGSGKSSKNKDILSPDCFIQEQKGSSQPQIYRVIRNDKLNKRPRKPKAPIKVATIRASKKSNTKAIKSTKLTVVSDSSEDSNDEEYKNKRRKLADAVSFTTKKIDNSSLKERIAKMLHPKPKSTIIRQNTILTGTTTIQSCNIIKSINAYNSVSECDDKLFNETTTVDSIIMPTDHDLKIVSDKEIHDTVDGIDKKDIKKCDSGGSSDEDLELLRQNALETKSSKQNPVLPEVAHVDMTNNKHDSEDEDSDTEELRLICLRSALLKKAIDMKKKQRLQKRQSQNSLVYDDLLEKSENNGNITDVENIDMDIGSDAEEKEKDPITHENKLNYCKPDEQNKKKIITNKEELDEDEDLLRAKLLTSLSKNLPIFADINILNAALPKEETKPNNAVPKSKIQEKKFIIQLGDSDSEAEHEATRNLTKMHMKLAEQTEFQLKLDQFLKSTRMQVEKTTVSDVVQTPVPVKPPNKFVPKTMKHLPKSEQMEYKNLVKRMRELEKLKQTRQLMLNNNLNKNNNKDMLKPRNISSNEREVMEKKLEEKIAKSRKIIAEESAKMLKLKEEAKKLSQRYKIVSNELRNITTAITLNKKQQRTVQNGLDKIRLQHQMLLKSSPMSYSTPNNPNVPTITNNKKQKENDPFVKDHQNANLLKSVKISLVNNLNKEANSVSNNSKLSVEVDVGSNKKVVKIPKTPERTVAINESPVCEETNEDDKPKIDDKEENGSDDYISPLNALGRTDWKEDPNAFLCPYEVDGSCRDSDCKFLHLQTQ